MTRTSIPTVDLDQFRSQNSELKMKFVDEIGSAYSDIGFVAIENHGIDQNLIDHLYDQIEKFFAFIITHHHLVVRVLNHIVRVQWDFPTTTGAINDELWNGVAGCVAT